MKTPSTFRFIDQSRYPIDNNIDFEYYCTTVLPDKIGNREYLPITWTAYYKAHGYGKDITALQGYLNGLDRTKKYFSICQYDDGVLNDVSHLDLMQFNMGSPGDYQLPLICQPHAYTPPTNLKKDIFCSFVGRITHPVRSKIVEQLTGKEGYYISTKPHGLLQFCEIMSRSKYVLCPRGYGATSFRICEALQYGAVPIYISDVHLKPHGINCYIEARPEDSLTELHKTYEGDFGEKMFGKFDKQPQIDFYQKYFTYEANKNLIIKALSNG